MGHARDAERRRASDREDGVNVARRWMDEHWDAMAQAARRYACSGAATPEDIAQEALCAAYERRDRLVDTAGERAWLLAFVRNKGREAVRRRGRRGKRLPVEYVDAEGDATYVECDDPRRERVLEAVRRLPESQQGIVRLMFDGYNDNEIAATTELKNGTLRVYRHRAIRKLKQMLGP